MEKTATFKTDMSIDDYHDLGSIKKHGNKAVFSKSQLALMDCPARFKYEYIDGGQEEEKDFLNVGNAVHTLALEPDLFHSRFYLLPEGVRRDKRMDAYKKHIEESKGRKIITANDYVDILGMAKALSSNKKAMYLLKAQGKIEASIFWKDEEHGFDLRCRPDFMRDDGLIVDLKTASSAEPNDFARSAFDCHYDMSVAMTCEGVEKLIGKKPDNYVFLAIEKKPPYIIEAYDSFRPWDKEDLAKTTYLDAGSFRYRKSLDKLSDCFKTGIWGSYSDIINPMAVPRYAMKKLEN
jgi:exodeoxyribonuclease VIII